MTITKEPPIIMAKTYKTDHLTKQQRKSLSESAGRQERIISRFYHQHQEEMHSPSQVHERIGAQWPITSTRRCLNTLTKVNVLRKTEHVTEGKYGRNEHLWTWRSEGQQSMFGKPKQKSGIQR